MSKTRVIGTYVILAAYITFIILIFVGAGFITQVVFNSNAEQLEVIGLTQSQANLARMSIVLFWLVFIPLCCVPFILFVGYGEYTF